MFAKVGKEHFQNYNACDVDQSMMFKIIYHSKNCVRTISMILFIVSGLYISTMSQYILLMIFELFSLNSWMK